MSGKSPDERLDGLPALFVVEPGSTAVSSVLGVADLVRWLDRRYAPKIGATHLDFPPKAAEPEPPRTDRHPFEPHHLRPELCTFEVGGVLICGRDKDDIRHVTERTPLPMQDESPTAMRAAVAALRREVEKTRLAHRVALISVQTSADLRDEALTKVKKLRRQRDRARIRFAGALAEIRRQDRVLADVRKQRAAALDRVRELETQDGEPPAGEAVDTPAAPGDAEAVLRVVEAARAWRERLHGGMITQGDSTVRAARAELINAVDALTDGPWASAGPAHPRRPHQHHRE